MTMRPSAAPTETTPSLIVELDGILATSPTFSGTATYTNPSGLLQILETFLGSKAQVSDAAAGSGITFYDWAGIRLIVRQGGPAAIAVSVAQFGSVAVSCQGGVTVGTPRATAVGLGAIDVGEGADSLGISARIVTDTASLTRPGTDGTDFLRLRFAADTVTQIQAPASDYGDL